MGHSRRFCDVWHMSGFGVTSEVPPRGCGHNGDLFFKSITLSNKRAHCPLSTSRRETILPITRRLGGERGLSRLQALISNRSRVWGAHAQLLPFYAAWWSTPSLTAVPLHARQGASVKRHTVLSITVAIGVLFIPSARSPHLGCGHWETSGVAVAGI